MFRLKGSNGKLHSSHSSGVSYAMVQAMGTAFLIIQLGKLGRCSCSVSGCNRCIHTALADSALRMCACGWGAEGREFGK